MKKQMSPEERLAREWKERFPFLISRFVTEDGDVGIIEDDGSVTLMQAEGIST